MKIAIAILALLTALNVRSQTTTGQDVMESQMNRYVKERPSESLLLLQPEKPNEIKGAGVSYSGVFVEFGKTDNLLELINPLAPPEYGSTEDNTAWDPVTGEATGLKLFSIQF